MPSVNADDYYKANTGSEKEYVRLSNAREVSKGDIVFIDSVRGVEQATAPADGYEIRHHISNMQFAQVFVARTNAIPADELELPVPKKDFTEDELKRIKPVRRYEEITLKNNAPDGADNGLVRSIFAEKDGFFIMQEDGKDPVFMSNFELTSCFNYAGQKRGIEEEIIIADKKQKPVKGIILAEDVTFSFKSSECFAPAGSFLYKNPHDEDGYTVDNWMKSPNSALRVAPGWAEKVAAKARRDAVAERQERLKQHAPRFRPI